MREIVHLQVGQCGNQMGGRFWRTVALVHGLGPDGVYGGSDDDQLAKLGVFFREGGRGGGHFRPRAVLADLEPGVIRSLCSSEWGALFAPDQCLTRQNSASNNFGRGYYTDGAEMAEEILDVVRRQVEDCDCLQGFQWSHSVGGGTGSGLGTLLMAKLREDYPDRMFCTYSVFPSPQVSETVVEPYNAILSTHQLLENADASFVLDNEALYHIVTGSLKQAQPTYGDLNHLVSQAMAGTTCSLRFPGQLNADLRKLAVNLVPFPRLHFFMTGVAPLTAAGAARHSSPTVAQLTQQLFDPAHTMCRADPRHGKFLTAAALFRGALATQEIDAALAAAQDARQATFAEWIPHNIKSSLCDVPPVGQDRAATFIGNSTATQEVFRRVHDQFARMLHRKAFLHWYTGEGMDEAEFAEASTNVTDLLAEYQQYEAVEVLVGEVEDEEEEAGGEDDDF